MTVIDTITKRFILGKQQTLYTGFKKVSCKVYLLLALAIDGQFGILAMEARKVTAVVAK